MDGGMDGWTSRPYMVKKEGKGNALSANIAFIVIEQQRRLCSSKYQPKHLKHNLLLFIFASSKQPF